MAVRGAFATAAAEIFTFSPLAGSADAMPAVSAEASKKAIAILVFIGAFLEPKFQSQVANSRIVRSGVKHPWFPSKMRFFNSVAIARRACYDALPSTMTG